MKNIRFWQQTLHKIANGNHTSVLSFQLLRAGHRVSRQLPTQGNAELTCTPLDTLSSGLWQCCSNFDSLSNCLLWWPEGWMCCLTLYSFSSSAKSFSLLKSNVFSKAKVYEVWQDIEMQQWILFNLHCVYYYCHALLSDDLVIFYYSLLLARTKRKVESFKNIFKSY